MSDNAYKPPVFIPRVPARYEEAKWEDVPENIQKLFEALPKSRKGLYIHGAVGTGKTHIAYALYKNASVKAPIWHKEPQSYGDATYREARAKFSNTTELLREIRLDFDRGYGDKAMKEEELMKHDGILFLDDIGAEKLSEWVMETFYLIINKRYNEKLPIIFTSNLDLGGLSNQIGKRIASRIAETCDVVELTGGDRRLKKSVDNSR